MQYADLHLNTQQLSLYMGFNPSGDGVTPVANPLPSSTGTVNQRDAELVHFWLKVGLGCVSSCDPPLPNFLGWMDVMGPQTLGGATNDSFVCLPRCSVHPRVPLAAYWESSFWFPARATGAGERRSSRTTLGGRLGIVALISPPPPSSLTSVHAQVRAFETYCGSLSRYGMKHMRSLANICNAGVRVETMAKVAAEACPTVPSNIWSLLHRGFSA
ncbi:hypothetical protein GW17_00010224 [Ensete ventricosum]|nr:hypothetical protein GW17_00010224 [Ensete ventricosum]